MHSIGQPAHNPDASRGAMRHEINESSRRVTLDITDVADCAHITLRAVDTDMAGITTFEATVAIALENPADIRDAAKHLHAIADRLDRLTRQSAVGR